MNFIHALIQIIEAMAPWLLFGFFAAGLFSLFLSPALISKHLGQRRGLAPVLKAVIPGIFLPLCSCGVLPVAASFRKAGASRGATAAFLIATPQTGVDSIFATYALMGWVFALTRPLVALFTGVVGGCAVSLVDDDTMPSTEPATQQPEPAHACCCCHHAKPAAPAKPVSKGNPVLRIFTYGFGELFADISKALSLGLIISALVVLFVPEGFFEMGVMSSSWVSMPAMLLIGIPMYVCSTASIPIAVALMAKGLAPGAALIFLIVGPALNGASLTVLLKLLGKKCAAIYLGTLALGALAAGILINILDAEIPGLLPNYAEVMHCDHAAEHSTIGAVCAVVFVALLLWHMAIKPLVHRGHKEKHASCCH